MNLKGGGNWKRARLFSIEFERGGGDWKRAAGCCFKINHEAYYRGRCLYRSLDLHHSHSEAFRKHAAIAISSADFSILDQTNSALLQSSLLSKIRICLTVELVLKGLEICY